MAVIKKNKNIIVWIFFIILVVFASYNVFFKSDVANVSYALSKYGSRSDEVKQIQDKLKRWGYYNGAVDGIYGSKTLEAVKYFQRKNGLTADRNSWNKNISSNGYN